MARVRVVVYRENSDEVLADFHVNDPDRNSYQVADSVENAIPEEIYEKQD